MCGGPSCDVRVSAVSPGQQPPGLWTRVRWPQACAGSVCMHGVPLSDGQQRAGVPDVGSQSSGAVRKFCAGEAEGAPAGCDRGWCLHGPGSSCSRAHLSVATGALLLGVGDRGASSWGGRSQLPCLEGNPEGVLRVS